MAHKVPCFNERCKVCIDSAGQTARPANESASTLPRWQGHVPPSTDMSPCNEIPGAMWEEEQATALEDQSSLLVFTTEFSMVLLFLILIYVDNTPALRRANIIMLVLSGLGVLHSMVLLFYGESNAGNHMMMKLAVNMRSSRFLTVIVHLPIFYSAVSLMAVLFFVVVYLSRETPAAAILVGILGTGLLVSTTTWAIRNRAGRVVLSQV